MKGISPFKMHKTISFFKKKPRKNLGFTSKSYISRQGQVILNTGNFSFGLTRQSEQCTEVLICTVEQAGNNLLKYTKIITI